MDAYFAWEPTNPDAPDPSTAGLAQVAQAAMATAVGWAQAAIASLNAWPSAQVLPQDPAWVVREALLSRHLGITAATPPAQRVAAIDETALPALHGTVRALAQPSPFLVVDAIDRATFVQRHGGGQYAGAALLTGAVEVLAFPISARYLTLSPASRVRNRMGLVSLAYEVATATPAPFRPMPTW